MIENQIQMLKIFFLSRHVNVLNEPGMIWAQKSVKRRKTLYVCGNQNDKI